MDRYWMWMEASELCQTTKRGSTSCLCVTVSLHAPQSMCMCLLCVCALCVYDICPVSTKLSARTWRCRKTARMSFQMVWDIGNLSAKRHRGEIALWFMNGTLSRFMNLPMNFPTSDMRKAFREWKSGKSVQRKSSPRVEIENMSELWMENDFYLFSINFNWNKLFCHLQWKLIIIRVINYTLGYFISFN